MCIIIIQCKELEGGAIVGMENSRAHPPLKYDTLCTAY